jgi:hypothetical protein
VFGLPIETALLVFGFPVFWFLYTIVFLVLSRNWDRDDIASDGAS